MFSDLVQLIYPNLCLGCETKLKKNEEFLCLDCRQSLAFTKFKSDTDNPVAKSFWGRIRMQGVTSLCHFQKEGVIQHVLHQIKYGGQSEFSEFMGEMLGHHIKALNWEIDCVTAVPLHPKKKQKRGYNQAELIANGVARVLNVPSDFKSLKRIQFTETQTNKSREERWKNVEQVFQLSRPDAFLEMNVLVIDDVITTGATLEATGIQIEKGGAKGIYVASLAYAEH